ncbi:MULTISPECIES: DUF6694 family lipoprotein [Xenorhabdus]|uniref:DUF6694 family lipoprotein n=1 Tax=Xenorhabdus TaxID=626 RepID=UPI0006499198|nr:MULTISPECIES: DUF6694 family lipoprotein [Xenorhabdus]KLU15075.1 hypothetical protein AAY47_12845 [Xenorhabdus griffiniae]KOP32300.1 hypothetical protein AFK69_16195 [Xenorhabdus sp. GDc328]
MKKILAVLAFSLFLIGCGEPKLDASNDVTMKESIQKMNDDLSPEDQVKFKKAIAKAIFKSGFSGGDEAQKNQALKEVLHGKTATEIIAMDQKISEKK